MLTTLRKIIEKDTDNKISLQNLLDKLGAMKMVLKVLSRDSNNLDADLLINFLLLANTMLEGGNNRV